MDLDSDAKEIYEYLKSYPGQFISSKEICRRAGGKRRFQEEPRWAYPVLSRMIDDKVLESDSLGHYRIKEEESPVKARAKRKKWVAPHIEKILKQSGKRFDIIDEAESS